MGSVRLPRFKRSPKIAQFRLTDRDREILKHVHRHRFLRSDHLRALLPSSHQQVLRRLQLLYHHGFLERPRCQIDYYQNGSRRMAYGIGNKGAGVLKRELALPFHRLEWGEKNRVGRLFLDHALMVSEIMVALETACRKRRGTRLLMSDMLELPPAAANRRQPFQWTVEIAKGIKCGVIPDRVFGLEYPTKSGKQNRTWFFLEADRATMPVARSRLDQTSFYRKLLAYQATWRRQVHHSQFGFSRFRVLTVTTNTERVRHLVETCSRLDSGRGLFLFADESALSAHGDILTMPWQTGHTGTTETLV